METLNIEKLQQELQKLGHERLDPNDPLFMDHLARRLELQWHYTKIQELLDDQQNKMVTSQIEFSESLRKAYSEWINEGGSHLKACIDESGNDFFQRFESCILAFKSKKQPSYLIPLLCLTSFCTGALVCWLIQY